jgi:hypothetical protein
MTNVLVGTLDSSPAATEIVDWYRAEGGDPERLVVLRGRAGIDALESPAVAGSLMSRWIRQLSRVFDTISTHIVDTAVNDLKNGRTVLVVRNVDSRHADEEGRRLQRLGVFHLHYSGRWTSVEHGLVPAPRATSMSTTSRQGRSWAC